MHVEFEPYHRSEILHGHLHLGGSNPGGERIEVNSLCLTRGGQPWLPVMGEFHFSRCDPAQWQTELCKMKAGGVTMVSTYLFWIHHEEREGELRFSGRLDVRRFVLCCRRAGLDVVLRIGPWAHGECRNGGFPDWLLHKGIPLRQNHPAYLALVRAWYRSIYRQVRGLLYRDGGPIVGIQLENELVDNSDHLAALKRIAVEEGFEVPLYTVTGWNAVSGARIRRRRCCRSLRPIPTPPGPSTAIRCPSRRSICSTPPATTRRWAPTCCTPPRRTAGSCPMTVTPSLPARSARASSPPTTAGCGSPAWTPTPSRSSSWDAATT